MSRLSSLRPPRRAVHALVVVVFAVAIAAAFTLDPGASTGMKSSGTATSVAPPSSPTDDKMKADGGYSVTDAAIGRADEANARAASPEAVSKTVAPVGDSIASEGAVGSASGGGLSQVDLGAKILRNASLEIEVKRSAFDRSYRQARSLAAAHGGYVVSSSARNDSNDLRTATITLRIPGGKFDDAIDELSDLGKIRNTSVSSEDVTEEYVDARSRLRHAQAVEGRLLVLLGKAKNVSDALVIGDRLDTVQQQIETEKGRLNWLEHMTAMSTVSIELVEKARPGKHAGGQRKHVDTWGFGAAFKTAAHRFVGNVNRAIISTGGALPALLILFGFGYAGRTWLRRRNARRTEDVS